MTTQASREDSLGALLPLFLTSDDQECVFDSRPRPDGVKFIRGILLGVVLCVPIWSVIWLLLTHRF